MTDATGQGRGLQAEYARLADKYNRGEVVELEGTANDKGGIHKFPARYIVPDPYDDVYKMKQTIADEDKKNNRQWLVTDEDAEYMLRKREGAEVAKFDKFFGDIVQPTIDDPARLQWARNVMPSYFQRREQIIREQAEIQVQLAMINAYGPQSEEDFKLLYAIAMGEIQIPEKPIHLLGDDADKYDDDYKRGVFNPRRIAYSMQKPALIAGGLGGDYYNKMFKPGSGRIAATFDSGPPPV